MFANKSNRFTTHYQLQGKAHLTSEASHSQANNPANRQGEGDL